MSTTKLTLLHFNDVYHMSGQTIEANGESVQIDASHFAFGLDKLRRKIKNEDELGEEPLLLFSGDLFSPSFDSITSRGMNMVELMKELKPDVCLPGNHEFDFQIGRFNELVKESKLEWIFSNVTDTNKPGDGDKIPEGLKEYIIFERGGIKIGVIGVIDDDWISTTGGWPSNFELESVTHACKRLSKKLRQEEGCDIVIALTHSGLDRDIKIAKSSHAYPANTPERCKDISNAHGADIVLGGHDHKYYAGKGVDIGDKTGYTWGYKTESTNEDDGLLIIKSGCDFFDLSEVTLEIVDEPNGIARNKLVKSVQVTRHSTTDEESLESVKTVMNEWRKDLDKDFDKPFCALSRELDVSEMVVRGGESAVGNWVADILLHCFDATEYVNNLGRRPDGAIVTGGSLRYDKIIKGYLTPKDIREISPYETTSVVLLKLTGDDIYAALEAGLRAAGTDNGCFPVVSGLRVKWDYKKDPMQRVEEIWIVNDTSEVLIKRGSEGPYHIVTSSFLHNGGDEYISFKKKKNVCPDGMPVYAVIYLTLLFGQTYEIYSQAIGTKDMANSLKHDMETLTEQLKPINQKLKSNAELSEEEIIQLQALGNDIERALKGYQYLEELVENPKDIKFLPMLNIRGLDADKAKRRLQDVSGEF